MKKANYLFIIVLASVLLNSCGLLYETGKIYVDAHKQTKQLIKEYEEAQKTRPSLTFNQFLEEKNAEKNKQVNAEDGHQ